MPKHRIEVDEGWVSIADDAPQPKRSKTAYSKIAPSHIPEVDVSVAVKKGTEKFDISIPESVVSKLPRLKQIAVQGLPAAAGHVELDENDLISLPGGIWGLLLVLKMLQVDNFDIGAVLVSDVEPESAAAALASAQYLGCDEVAVDILLWLKEEVQKGTVTSDVVPAHDIQSRGIAIRQVLDALPDEEFRLQCDHPNQLLDTTAEALTLPARLKVKWLRANALVSLDLSAPGDAWSTQSWQSLVACLHAVPALERLHVKLPRAQTAVADAPADSASPEDPPPRRPSGAAGDPPSAPEPAAAPPTSTLNPLFPCAGQFGATAGSAPADPAPPFGGFGSTSVPQNNAFGTTPGTQSAFYRAGVQAARPKKILSGGAPYAWRQEFSSHVGDRSGVRRRHSGSKQHVPAATLPPEPQPPAPEPTPPSSATPPPESSPPAHEPEAFVTTEALAALAHVSTALPALQHLHLVDSPISVNDVATFSAALASFSASLTSLCIEVWRARDLSCSLPQDYPQAARQQVLSAIARLQLLQKLEIPDWINLAREDCEGGSCLSRLQSLKEIAVWGFPCRNCEGGRCRHFARSLPFKALENSGDADGGAGRGEVGEEGQENAGELENGLVPEIGTLE